MGRLRRRQRNAKGVALTCCPPPKGYPATDRHYIRSASILAFGKVVGPVRFVASFLQLLIQGVIRRVRWTSGEGANDKSPGVIQERVGRPARRWLLTMPQIVEDVSTHLPSHSISL